MAVGRYSRTTVRPEFKADSLQEKMFVPMYKTQQHQMAQQQANDMLFNAPSLQKDTDKVNKRLGSYEAERSDVLEQLQREGITPGIVSRVQGLGSAWKKDQSSGMIGKATSNYNSYSVIGLKSNKKLHKDNPSTF